MSVDFSFCHFSVKLRLGVRFLSLSLFFLVYPGLIILHNILTQEIEGFLSKQKCELGLKLCFLIWLRGVLKTPFISCLDMVLLKPQGCRPTVPTTQVASVPQTHCPHRSVDLCGRLCLSHIGLNKAAQFSLQFTQHAYIMEPSRVPVIKWILQTWSLHAYRSPSFSL